MDEPTEVVQNTIVIYDNILSPDMCQKIIEHVSAKCKFEKSPTHLDLSNGQSENEYRSSSQVVISIDPQLKELDKALFDIFHHNIKKYTDHIIQTGLGMSRETANALTINEDDGYVLLKYTSGGKYDIHYDQALHENKTKGVRVISAILYLNDDFLGGETYFKYQDYTLKPKPGRLVFFPSTYTHPHMSLPVRPPLSYEGGNEGVKYAIVTWFR